jgi:predicted TIM-barrel fold metal-dependent hydrolase
MRKIEMIVDLEHHMFTEEQTIKGRSKSGSLVERYVDSEGNMHVSTFEAAANVENHLQFMDEAGIDVAVLSANRELSVEKSRTWNDSCARIIQEHSKRFVGFASIPPLGGKPALEELERAINELGLKGVHIFTRSGALTLDHKEYWPFYEKVSELKIPIDVHITSSPQGFDALRAPYPLYYIMAREYDICAATLRICLGGVLEDFPDMSVIINHFGGGISAVLERLDAYMDKAVFYPGKPLISKPWRAYFNKLYFNMAGRERGMDTVKCALTNINPEKIMFGTDWPFTFGNDAQGAREYIADIRKLDLSREDINGMLGGNATKLLGIEQDSYI